MAEVTLDNVPERVRDYYRKGVAALQKGNLDYAIDMMSSCLELEPRFLDARKALRDAEIQKLLRGKVTPLTHAMSTATGISQYLQGMALLKSGKGLQALAVAEKLLKRDALNMKFVMFFAEAAQALSMSEAAIHTLEKAHDASPDDLAVIKALARLYLDVGRMRESRYCYERLCEKLPDDFQLRKALKDVTALASMRQGGWEAAADGGSYRDMMKNTEEAALLEKESKAVRTDRDTDALIRDMRTRIEREPMNVNYYRALSRLHIQTRQFDEAVSVLRKAAEIAAGDPEVHAALSSAILQKMDHEISELREAGREEDAETMEAERTRFIHDDLQERVRRYPNDLGVRFEWGMLLLERGNTNEAIQQFQMSQRSPKFRTRSLLQMALCFKQKSQYDMALEQLKTADSELPVMDGVKKDIVYEIARLLELTGDSKQAVFYYKQIYAVDIAYRDVAAKVEQTYRGS
ncbi:MAG: tetratricopeptide repeat protein [Lentisphaerae bacterium]|nr:tetratricopeptide repeat protein [Lentisphaerota bacterium]